VNPRQPPGRALGQLLADFGHPLPQRTTTPAEAAQPRLFPRLRSPRGQRVRGAGWTPGYAPLSRWRMTSDQAPVFWPFIAGPCLPPTGAQMGIDEFSGGAFYADPNGWVLDEDIPVTNPNMFIMGKPGTGKSTYVKQFIIRMLEFGYRALILGDAKDEYELLCAAFGVHPFAIGPGQPTRVNPLDIGPLGHGWNRLPAAEANRRAAIIFARWLVLVRGLVGSQHVGEARVPFSPSDARVVDTVLRQLTGYRTGNSTLRQVTIPALWHTIDEPTTELATACRFASRQDFLEGTRLLRDALAQMVTGHLAGMFDQPTNIDIDWAAPIQSLSLGRLARLGDDAVGVGLTCLGAWGRGQREIAAPGDRRIVVRDEMWKQMRLGPEAVKSLDADLRLSRLDGDVQIAVAHKPSDTRAVGAQGSEADRIARDLLHLADTKVLLGQDQAVSDELGELLGLSPRAQTLVTGWAMAGKGRALWLVGNRTYKVASVRHPLEHALTNTNDALTDARSKFA
ncbi:MAG: ATP-binding protein, partial [Dermatophilaceae bacterium]